MSHPKALVGLFFGFWDFGVRDGFSKLPGHGILNRSRWRTADVVDVVDVSFDSLAASMVEA